MLLRRMVVLALAMCLMLIAPPTISGAGVTLTIDAGRTGTGISPTLFGLMFEDINHSGDGGIYGELLADRSFLDDPTGHANWSLVTTGRAQGSFDLDTSQPINKTALTTSLRLTIARVGADERVGIANGGYYGLPVRPGTLYHVAFYARRSADFSGPLKVSLESTAGRVFAAALVSGISTSWRRYTLSIKVPFGIQPSETNQFVISMAHTGRVWFNLVSLFPATWNNRANGLRVDLMRLLKDMHPGFLRFPGGNFLEGQTIGTRFAWKNTIGALSLRPGHLDDAWGYRSSDGLGLLEYLEWCADLHMMPVLGVYAGYSLDGQYVQAGPRLRPYVQDALDEIQYATGSSHTVWGARRTADGHPAPFTIPYVEIGNEDSFDQSGGYDGRFAQFFDAIRRTYPSMKLIATTTVHSRTPDVYDQHFYESPQWFVANAGYYDHYSRNGPSIFVGEYAAQTSDIGQSEATLGAALGEAAWMTGLERNADLVAMASYAPLFANESFTQWNPDLIGFDSLSSFGSPSYYVQKLFSLYHGDVTLPSKLDGRAALAFVASKASADGTLYLTVVNTATSAQITRIVIKGVASIAARGEATVLTSGSLDDQNSLSAPVKVVPSVSQLAGVGDIFTYRFQPNSVTVLKLAMRKVVR